MRMATRFQLGDIEDLELLCKAAGSDVPVTVVD